MIYIQRMLANIWKKNLLEDIKVGKMQFELTGEFLAELKREFGKCNNKSAKVVKLKRVK